jgi:hypothetical protein
VRPEGKHDPRRETDNPCREVARHRSGSIHRASGAIAAARAEVIEDRPREERTEQQQVGQRAIRDQVRERPDLDPRDHRMADCLLDPRPRHVGRDQQDERRKGQQRSQMPRPQRRTPDHHRRQPRFAVAVDEEHEAHDREEGVDRLPAVQPELRHLRVAKARREDAGGMDTEKDHEAEDQQGHGRSRDKVSGEPGAPHRPAQSAHCTLTTTYWLPEGW